MSQAFDIEIPLFSIRHGTTGGLSSAIYNLTAGLTSLGCKVSLPFSDRDRLDPGFLTWPAQNQSVARQIDFRRYPRIPGGMAVRFLEETIYAQAPHRSRHILYPNYFLPPQVMPRAETRSVLIHDCQYRVFPQNFSPRKRQWLDVQFRRSLRSASHVFLISEFEKTQMARYFGESLARRCTVIYNAVEWSRYEHGVIRDSIHELASHSYILTVGNDAPHKNALKMVRAFLKVAGRYPDLSLILVGRISAPMEASLQAEIPAAYQTRILRPGLVSDAELGLLYRQARLFVMASSYEGFGMPPVEAMGYGIPVLVTNGTALPEVTLGFAEYCPDDDSPELWAEAITHCLDHPMSPEHYRTAAAAVRARFSPVAVAGTVLRDLGLTPAPPASPADDQTPRSSRTR